MLVRINNFLTLQNTLQKDIKPLENWSNRDFLLHFSHRYKTLTGQSYKIPKEAWVGMLSRMKGMRTKLKLDNTEYKNFIDKVFDKFFTKANYVPNFGSIVSEKVFYITKKLIRDSSFSNAEFVRLREQLYNNNELFKKLV